MDPVHLASSGYSVEHGAAILVLRLKCHLATARKAMIHAHHVLDLSADVRLTSGLTKIACEEAGGELVYGPVECPAEDATGFMHVRKAETGQASSVETTVPVQWTKTNNRGALVKSI